MTDSVLIVAAEASSTLYAKRLLEHWIQEGQKVHSFGVGSREMEAQGFEIVGRSEELAVVGLQEVLSHWSEIKKTFKSLLTQVEKRKPKFALLLDYPDFNLRLAKKLKALGIPVVYYISPQVWAWRKSRVHKIKKVVDKMLVLFPFEKEFYESHGVPVQFVGHPLLDELGERYFSDDYFKLRRSRYGLKPEDKLLGLMPGSRHSELKYHLNLQIEVARGLVRKDPHLKVGLLVAPTFEVNEVRRLLPLIDFPLMFIKDDPFRMIHITDGVLCASGTATLLVGLMKKPLVIMYKMNGLTAFFLRRLVRGTKYFGMVNLILNKEVGEEFFQEKTNVKDLSEATRKILYSEEWIQKVRSELDSLSDQLGQREPQ